MDIHEYQAKEILAKFGVGVPPGALAYSPEQAAYRARELGGDTWVVKAQVHAGGREKRVELRFVIVILKSWRHVKTFSAVN